MDGPGTQNVNVSQLLTIYPKELTCYREDRRWWIWLSGSYSNAISVCALSKTGKVLPGVDALSNV